jgi:hypothetical protein
MAAFTVIDHTEVGAGGVASWGEAAIPSSYDHLLLVMSNRTVTNYTTDDLKLRVGNGSIDTGSNYSHTRMYATGTTVASTRQTNQDAIRYIYTSGNAASSTANTFASIKVWIPNYANTTGFKPVLISVGKENASTASVGWYVSVQAGLWQSTSAITDIEVSAAAGQDTGEYSTFTLYGVTGA